MLTPNEKLVGLNQDFLNVLTKIASNLPFDLRITSGKRDPQANAAAGGVRDSAHEAGIAVDVGHDGDILKAMRIAYELGKAGIIRVGFYDRHIHFDTDKTKPQGQWEGKSK